MAERDDEQRRKRLLDLYQSVPPTRPKTPPVSREQSISTATPGELDALESRLRAEQTSQAMPSNPLEQVGSEIEQIVGTPPPPQGSKQPTTSSASMGSDEAESLIQQLREERERAIQGGAPESLREMLRRGQEKAEELYQKRADRSDWMELAQILTRAGAQFAGAQQGMRTGRDMSGLQFGPGVDFEGRRERAFREYQQQLSNIGKQADVGLSERAEARRERALAAEPRIKEMEERLALERDRIRGGRIREDAEAAEDRTAEKERKAILKDEIKKVENRLRNIREINAAFDPERNIDEQEFRSTFGDEAAAGKLSLDKLFGIRKPGVVYGTNPDRKAQKEYLKQEEDRVEAELVRLNQEMSAPPVTVLQTKRPVSEVRPAPVSPPPVADVVRVEAPTGETQSISRTAWETKYSKRPGYKLVE